MCCNWSHEPCTGSGGVICWDCKAGAALSSADLLGHVCWDISEGWTEHLCVLTSILWELNRFAELSVMSLKDGLVLLGGLLG